MKQHLLHLYATDDQLVGALERFVATSLDEGASTVLILTEPHLRALCARLAPNGVDLRALAEHGQVQLLDADDALATLLEQGPLSNKSFARLFGPVLEKARAIGRNGKVKVCGEAVDVLWRRGEADTGAQLEAIWNDTLHGGWLSVLCPYGVDVRDRAVPNDALSRVVRAHGGTRVAAGDAPLLTRAIGEVLSPAQAAMLRVVVEADHPAATTVEAAGALQLLWLRMHMPRTADRILARVHPQAAG